MQLFLSAINDFLIQLVEDVLLTLDEPDGVWFVQDMQRSGFNTYSTRLEAVANAEALVADYMNSSTSQTLPELIVGMITHEVDIDETLELPPGHATDTAPIRLFPAVRAKEREDAVDVLSTVISNDSHLLTVSTPGIAIAVSIDRRTPAFVLSPGLVAFESNQQTLYISGSEIVALYPRLEDTSGCTHQILIRSRDREEPLAFPIDPVEVVDALTQEVRGMLAFSVSRNSEGQDQTAYFNAGLIVGIFPNSSFPLDTVAPFSTLGNI